MTTCPEHNCKLLPVPHPSGRGHELRCPSLGCTSRADYAQPGMTTPKLPGMDRGRQARAVTWKEADTERAVDQGASLSRWDCLSTAERRAYQYVECPACRHGWQMRPTGGTGVTPGVPDRLFAPPWLPPFLWIGTELKGSDTPFTASANDQAQERLAGARRIVVARNWDDVQMTVNFVRAMMQPILSLRGDK